jgi:membrane protease YdiL (CAAX protease family)
MKGRLWLALGFALVFPTAMAWVYAMALTGPEGKANPLLQSVYAASKVVQFTFPILCMVLIDRRLTWPGRPTLRGLPAALGFGLVVDAGMLLLYYGFLRGTVFFEEATARLKQEMGQFELASPAGFALYAGVFILVHSLLEEYYWRWFVFGWLQRVASVGTALALSSVAFGIYHVWVLAGFFPGWLWLAVVPFGVCTGLGGAVWAWLYQRSGSIYAPWLSHLVVEAGLFVLGYDMYFG